MILNFQGEVVMLRLWIHLFFVVFVGFLMLNKSFAATNCSQCLPQYNSCSEICDDMSTDVQVKMCENSCLQQEHTCETSCTK